MDTNEQKSNCQNSTPNKQTNLKSSKTVFSNDSDVFYDVPDENDSSIPKSSNRSRTTQNDRNRDHTNLSHEPNIEAPAGLRQQPAGHRQTNQAKDKNDENDDGNNITDKERTYLGGSFLCANVSQDKFSNLSSEAGSSIVKLSFSTNACLNLHGSYECFCAKEEEDEEAGSCHNFWCQRYEVLGNRKKTIEEDSLRTFESQKKLIERKEDNDTSIACCSQETIFDFKTEPTYECLCVRKRSIVSSCTGSCKNEELESRRLKSPNPNEREDNTDPSPKVENLFEQKSRHKSFENSENFISNATEDLFECEEFENTELLGRLYLKDSKMHEGKHSQGPNLNESFRSVGTGITPRQTMNDENVVPLLKSIFDVLQTMRQEKLHLSPIASKNIDIDLDEPFNGLPPPPAPPSSPKFSRQLLGISSDSQSCIIKSSRNNLKLEKGTDRDFINSEDNWAILEPPERDVQDFEKSYQDASTRSQRLIPVDMDLLRTDEELIWEPDSNSDKPEVEIEEFSRLDTLELGDIVPLKPQFRKFPEEARSETRESSQDSQNSEKAESTTRRSNLKRSFSMEVDSCDCMCGEPENYAEDCCRKLSNTNNFSDDQITTAASLQKLRICQNQQNYQTQLQIPQVSQAVQVNLVSLQNLTSRSEEQFLTFKDLSEETLLKTSEINKSKDTMIPKVNSQKSISKIDVGTDCNDFDNDVGNDDRSSSKSCHCSQETTQPQNQEMSQFIESILFDLKAMDSFRKNNSHWQSFARLPSGSTTGGWQRPSKALSYPVTIETVRELGANSLFVKWRVQNFGNIGGYEIFLDGHLTNRYFNCIHQAAVICDVDLHCHHRITLRAQPLFPLSTSTDSCSSSTLNKKYPSNSTTHLEASCPQPDGSVWYPSVYHFEPNSLSAPENAVLY